MTGVPSPLFLLVTTGSPVTGCTINGLLVISLLMLYLELSPLCDYRLLCTILPVWFRLLFLSLLDLMEMGRLFFLMYACFCSGFLSLMLGPTTLLDLVAANPP